MAKYNPIPKIEEPQYRSGFALGMQLEHYNETLKHLDSESIRTVVLAHQVFFPHSSATGFDTLAGIIRKNHRDVMFQDFQNYHGNVCRDFASRLIENNNGFALLIAGTLEHYAKGGFPRTNL